MQQRSGSKRFYNFDYLTVKGCIPCSIENKFVNVFFFFRNNISAASGYQGIRKTVLTCVTNREISERNVKNNNSKMIFLI